MKRFSRELLAKSVAAGRKARGLSQSQLAQAAGINRSLLRCLEQGRFLPSPDPLDQLAQALDLDAAQLWCSFPFPAHVSADRPYRIAVAGTGYVGLSIATVLMALTEAETDELLANTHMTLCVSY